MSTPYSSKPERIKSVREPSIREDLETEYPSLALARLKLSACNYSRRDLDHMSFSTIVAEDVQEPSMTDRDRADEDSSSLSSCDANIAAAAAAEDCAYGPHSKTLGAAIDLTKVLRTVGAAAATVRKHPTKPAKPSRPAPDSLAAPAPAPIALADLAVAARTGRARAAPAGPRLGPMDDANREPGHRKDDMRGVRVKDRADRATVEQVRPFPPGPAAARHRRAVQSGAGRGGR